MTKMEISTILLLVGAIALRSTSAFQCFVGEQRLLGFHIRGVAASDCDAATKTCLTVTNAKRLTTKYACGSAVCPIGGGECVHKADGDVSCCCAGHLCNDVARIDGRERIVTRAKRGDKTTKKECEKENKKCVKKANKKVQKKLDKGKVDDAIEKAKKKQKKCKKKFNECMEKVPKKDASPSSAPATVILASVAIVAYAASLIRN